MNGRLARSLGMTTERRASILKIWRKEVKPLVQEATDHPETFDEEAFDAQLCEIFDRVRPVSYTHLCLGKMSLCRRPIP